MLPLQGPRNDPPAEGTPFRISQMWNAPWLKCGALYGTYAKVQWSCPVFVEVMVPQFCGVSSLGSGV